MEDDCRCICLSLERDLKRVTHAMVRGDWDSAISHLSRCLEYGTAFQWSHHEQQKRDQFTDVVNMLITAGRKAATMMDYKLSSDFYMSTLAVVQSTGLCGNNEVVYICQATQYHVENLFHTHQPDAIVEYLKLAWQHYLRGVMCEDVSHLLCNIHLRLGMEYLKKTMVSSAKEQLQLANEHFQQVPGLTGSVTEAQLKSSLGCCYLLSTDLTSSIYMLSLAKNMWKKLNWPLEEIELIISTYKHYVLAQLQIMEDKKNKHIFIDVTSDLVQLHHVLYKLNQSMIVADTFTQLGMNAFYTDNEKQAISYFQQSLELYKQATPDKYMEEILRLLRFIGVACYNTREFEKACRVYHERLQLLEASQSMDINILTQIADCHASLGFTYSRLRNFDKMLMYYERALASDSRLTAEDIQLIETNIGSLYHVKAVKLEKQGSMEESAKYYDMAEEAFTKALRYSWKSFPFINYGYYLYFRGQYNQCLAFLQQGYLNSVLDKDTVEFDHTEDLILTPDLREELEDRDHIRVPAVIVSLYLKCLAHHKLGNIDAARYVNKETHTQYS